MLKWLLKRLPWRWRMTLVMRREEPLIHDLVDACPSKPVVQWFEEPMPLNIICNVEGLKAGDFLSMKDGDSTLLLMWTGEGTLFRVIGRHLPPAPD